jgi:hypothetical protein
MDKVHYTSIFSEEALQDALDRKLVNKRKHPELPLWIYNYGVGAVFSWEWSDCTLNCRGLILDEEGFIRGRSFKKFFSYEQLNGQLPEGPFIIEEKMDGSLVEVINYNGQAVVSTRGSFESEQAKLAKSLLAEQFLPVEGETWVFELIGPDNAVVCRYPTNELVLLTVMNLDGTEQLFQRDYTTFRTPKIYTFSDLEEILNYEEDNIEGFVLRYESGELVKIKTENYRNLHKYITGVSEKTIWEHLKEGTFEQWLEQAPDETMPWIKEVQKELEDKFMEIKTQAMSEMKDFGDRKTNALYYQTCKFPSVMFHLLDNKPVDEMIWKLVRPQVTKVFKMISEDSN